MSESVNFEKWQYKAKDALPCPYCGGESISVKHKEVKFYGFNAFGFKKHRMKAYCVCNKCGATGTPIYYDGYSNASYGFYDEEHKRIYSCGDEAIKAWNTRKPMDRIVERLEENKKACKRLREEHEKNSFQNGVKVMKYINLGLTRAITIIRGEGAE